MKIIFPAPAKVVIQEETTGCGIASAAAIAGVSYAAAKKAANGLGIFVEDARLWSDTAHMRRLLDYYGFRTVRKEIAFRSWSSLPDLALLAIKWHVERKQPFWHWVVFIRDTNGASVLDSKKSLRRHRRTDFGRMKPKWFIGIERVLRGAQDERRETENI